mgnify:CR=1 FL=1
MAYKEWKNQYNVSVKKFNDDHKKLFSYLNELHRGLVSGLNISDMGYILRGLVDYTVSHFKNEERLMLKFDFPEYKDHKKEHDDLLEEVSAFYEDFQAGKQSFSLELLSFLDNWVTNHILTTDMKYKTFFELIAKKQQEERAE